MHFSVLNSWLFQFPHTNSLKTEKLNGLKMHFGTYENEGVNGIKNWKSVKRADDSFNDYFYKKKITICIPLNILNKSTVDST